VNAALDRYREATDAALAAIAAETGGADTVTAAVRYAIDGGGKRLRPALCLAAMAAIRPGAAPESDPHAVRAAAAVELIHTYSLVHDDLPCMDDDALRRGRATVHRAFDTSAAMLAGLALLPLAARTLADAVRALRLEPAVRAAAQRELFAAAGAGGMVGGQVLDLEAEGTPTPAVAELRRIHAMKTGALFSCALRIGGMLGGAAEPQLAALGRFGSRLGLAFQIADDVLDVTREAGTLGKTPGKDRDALKSTYISLLGVAGAGHAARAEAAAAIAALDAAGIRAPVLAELARFAAERDR
jgi:geranylgeranyl pyrophosphate synthase